MRYKPPENTLPRKVGWLASGMYHVRLRTTNETTHQQVQHCKVEIVGNKYRHFFRQCRYFLISLNLSPKNNHLITFSVLGMDIPFAIMLVTTPVKISFLERLLTKHCLKPTVLLPPNLQSAVLQTSRPVILQQQTVCSYRRYSPRLCGSGRRNCSSNTLSTQTASHLSVTVLPTKSMN